MIKLLTYHEIDQQQWNELVQSSPTVTWFQTDEAYRFYLSVSGMQAFVYGVEENECKVDSVKCKGEENGKADNKASTPYTLHPTTRLKGVIVGYITRERNALKQLFTRRAIIIGGPLLAEDIGEDALSALLSAVVQCKVESVKCKSDENEIKGERLKVKGDEISRAENPTSRLMKPIYIETRNFHDYSKWKSVFEANGFAYQPHLNIQVTCDETHTMSEQRIRQVKKALKNGAEIVEAQREHEIRDWYQILSQLYREKVRTPLFSEEFFLEFHRKGVGKYLLVKYDGKVIGGMMCPILEGKAIYEWYVCGMDEVYRDLYPSVVATYAAIEYAKQNDIPLFDFMGAGVPDIPYGVRDFKSEFGGELVEHGRFLYIRKPLLYWIGKMGVKWLKRK